MVYRCKVCGYDQMPHAPRDYSICPCCGVEYGVDDAFESYEELRDEWLAVGAPWFSNVLSYIPPPNWSAWNQLDLAGYSYNVPRPESNASIQFEHPAIPYGFQLLEVVRQRPEVIEA
jgi:hypothetical protein